MCYVTKRLDIPGYSSTNKRVYRKLYSILYKSSQKLYLRCSRIRFRDGLKIH